MSQPHYERLLALALSLGARPDPSLGAPLLLEAQRRDDLRGVVVGSALSVGEERWAALRALLLGREAEVRALFAAEPQVERAVLGALDTLWGDGVRDYETTLGKLAGAQTPLIISFCNTLYISDDTTPPAVPPWHRVLHSAALSRVTSLSLDDIKGHTCAKHIASAEHLKNLSHLALCGGLDAEDAHTLLAKMSESSLNIKSLDIAWNNFTSPQIATILQGATCKTLQTLDLSGNFLGLEGAYTLAESEILKQLQRLDLTFNELDEQAAVILLSAQNLQSLESINLSGNHLGPNGAETLAKCQGLKKLKSLHLGWCGLMDQGAQALANSEYLSELQDLDLLSCRIGPRGALALASSPFLASLESLNLSGNPIGARGIETIKKSPCLGRLRRFTYDR